jgi:hypothetical protein
MIRTTGLSKTGPPVDFSLMDVNPPKTPAIRSRPPQRDVRVVDVIETGATVLIAASKAIPDLAVGLGAATGLAEKIIELTQQVTHNKRRCRFVATRIRGVMKILDTSRPKLGDEHLSQVQSLIK